MWGSLVKHSIIEMVNQTGGSPPLSFVNILSYLQTHLGEIHRVQGMERLETNIFKHVKPVAFWKEPSKNFRFQPPKSRHVVWEYLPGYLC